MNWAMRFGISAPYTQQELYELWCNFREDPNADKILSDFMDCDKKTAGAVIDEFESRFRHDRRYEREGKDY